jgi:hypothetical protein|tara:strand:- start:262 stop:444 length:183 start_codon:yes stop_codon:yes gene_type:complete
VVEVVVPVVLDLMQFQEQDLLMVVVMVVLVKLSLLFLVLVCIHFYQDQCNQQSELHGEMH